MTILHNRPLYFFLKITLILLNLMEIIYTAWLLNHGIKMTDERVLIESDEKEREELSLNKTILIISAIMASLLFLVGLLGAITSNYGCIVSYAIVVGVILMASLVSPSRTRIPNLVVIMVITVTSTVFAFMIRARELRDEENDLRLQLYVKGGSSGDVV